MRSCGLLEEPLAETISSSRLPEMPHALHPLRWSLGHCLANSRLSFAHSIPPWGKPFVDKGGRTGFHSGYTQRRGSTTEFSCVISLCNAPLANGEL